MADFQEFLLENLLDILALCIQVNDAFCLLFIAFHYQ